MGLLTEDEMLRLNDLLTPAELIEALDLKDLELLEDVLVEYATEIRKILEEH